MSLVRSLARLPHAISARLDPLLPPRKVSVLGADLLVHEPIRKVDPDYDDAWLLCLISSSTAYLDVGCNLGYFTLLACALRPGIRVVGVDANPEALAFAAAHIARNGLGERANFSLAFMSDAPDQTVEFFSVGLGAAGSGVPGMSHQAEQKHRSMMVTTDTIDRLCERLAFDPDLVKVDVEGAEVEVLKGADNVASRGGASFLVEMHSPPSRPMRSNAEMVMAWCEEHRLEPYYLKQHTRLDDADQVAGRGRCHLLLQPVGKPYPDRLRQIPQSAPIESLPKAWFLGNTTR